MKKLIVLSLMFGSMMFAPPAAEAVAAATSAGAPQIVVQTGRRNRRWRRDRRTRVVTSTRIRCVGPYRYRETIRTTYFANGTTRTVVVSRVRLGGRRIYRRY
jgi:hypothetical protein